MRLDNSIKFCILHSAFCIIVRQEYLKSQDAIPGDDAGGGYVNRYLNILNKEDKSQTFSKQQLIMMLVDTLIATGSTIPTVITQIFKYLIHHPRILKKAQDEIDRVVGTGRLVTWDDRKNPVLLMFIAERAERIALVSTDFPFALLSSNSTEFRINCSLLYVEAVIREVMRISSSLPFSVFHRAVKDTTLGGYTIPADTPIVTNLAAMHHDPDLWGDPDNFRPERFIDEDGALIKDMSLPFGLGHRVCPGETYSRYYVFGLTSALLQTFNFFAVEGEPSKPGDDLPGLLITPKECWLRYESR
ncbi:Probable cytochrome P450 304a1 [Harpegnathos saltator]|uniref:Probable cytochrome P450 304a1 n=1 Tax=Harpegnathos saltator TaxID=610380 RepID=E2BXM3_HARSA|nr:Probable cytochrome P450 304a1 [Harpegnathos saltator]